MAAETLEITLASVGLRRLKWSLQASIVFALALVGFGWALVPTANPVAPAIVLIGCGVFWHWAISVLCRADQRSTYAVLIFGGLSALVFVPSILVEYTNRTVNNTAIFLALFALWLACGAMVGAVSGQLRQAVLSATVSAQIAALASIITMLASYYVLRGSDLQNHFFRTEGTYDDFARSGGRDFGAFVVEDMFGGTFFHLMLGTCAGALMGIIGGALVVGARRFFRQRI